MKTHLYITGSMGSDKSRLIRDRLGDRLMYAGGYITEMAINDRGMLAGMELYPAAAAYVGGFAGEMYLDCSSFPPSHDNEVFRTTGVRLLDEAGLYPFALLDELGGYELIIPQYREALFRLLQSEVPIIAALKRADEADMMRQSLGLGDRVNTHVAALWTLIENDSEAELINLDTTDEDIAAKAVEAWVQTYC